MAQKIKWTEKKIAELEKAGYGRGTGADYKPWIEVSDFSSRGRSRRVWSHKTNRTHHLFSDVERDLFLALEWSRDVLDIKEQYPLDRDITQDIARKLGIRHPHYPGTQVPTVMTVDFLVTKATSADQHCIAFNAKRDEEAEDEVSLLKLEIQRSYFELMETPHHLIYHSKIPKQKVSNIDWIRSAMLMNGEIEPRPGMYAALRSRMSSELAQTFNNDKTLAEYCSEFDGHHGLEPGAGLRIARMLMQERIINVDLTSPDLPNEPLTSFMTVASPRAIFATGGR